MHGPHRGGGKPVGGLGVGGVGDDACQGFGTQLCGGASAGHHQGGSAVVDGRAAGGGDGAVFFERGFEGGDLVKAGLARAFVDGHHGLAAAVFDCDGGDLGGECAGRGGGLGALHAGDGKSVLLLAGEVVFGGAVFTKGAHGATGFVRIFQAVEHHVVKDAVVAHAVAAPAFLQQVGGVGHTFHTACHHYVVAPGQQHVVREHGGFHARATHFGQGDGPSALRQAAFKRRLARGGLALACHQAVAKQHFTNQIRGDTRTFDRCLDGRTAEVVGGQRREVALECAHGGAGGTEDNDGIGHVVSLNKGGELRSAAPQALNRYGKSAFRARRGTRRAHGRRQSVPCAPARRPHRAGRRGAA